MLSTYSEKYGKLPIDNLSDAESILCHYSNTTINTKVVNFVYNSWKRGCFGEPAANDRIAWLVDQTIAYIDDLVKNQGVLRRNLPGKEKNSSDQVIMENQSETIASQQRESEIKSQTVASQQRESEIKSRESEIKSETIRTLTKENATLRELLLSPQRDLQPARMPSNIAPRAFNLEDGIQANIIPDDEVGVPRNGGAPQDGDAPQAVAAQAVAAPPNVGNEVQQLDVDFDRIKTPKGEIKDRELVKIVSTHSTHGNKVGRLDKNGCKSGLFKVDFADGTSKSVRKASVVFQRAHLIFEDEESVVITELCVEKKFCNRKASVVLANCTDNFVVVKFDEAAPTDGEEMLHGFHKDCVVVCDW